MVVLNSVLIKGPGYRVEDCKAGKGGEGAVGRVKKVVSFALLFPPNYCDFACTPTERQRAG